MSELDATRAVPRADETACQHESGVCRSETPSLAAESLDELNDVGGNLGHWSTDYAQPRLEQSA